MSSMTVNDRSTTICINVSIALTLLVTMTIKYAVPQERKNHVLSFFRTLPQPAKLDDVIAELATASAALSDAELKDLAQKNLLTHSPDENAAIFSALLKTKNNKNANLLGVYLMESSGFFYKNPNLLYYASTYYANGTYVAKDVHKAQSLLSNDLMKDNVSAQYQLGLLYLDPAFPDHNAATARELIQKAADGGLAVAQKKLLSLPAP